MKLVYGATNLAGSVFLITTVVGCERLLESHVQHHLIDVVLEYEVCAFIMVSTKLETIHHIYATIIYAWGCFIYIGHNIP